VHGKQRNIYVHIYSSFFCTLARITHPIEDFIRNVPFYFTNIISESFIWDGNDIPSYLTTAWGWVDVLHELLVVFLPHVHGLLSWESRLVSSHQSNVHASHRPAPSKPNAPLSLSNAHAWVVVVAATKLYLHHARRHGDAEGAAVGGAEHTVDVQPPLAALPPSRVTQ
jgi:hypothetical protein